MNSENKKIPCDGIIFDIDGTIWDATDTAVMAYNAVLNEHPEFGFTLKSDDLKRVFGLPMDEIGRRIFRGVSPERSHDMMVKVLDLEPAFLQKFPPDAYPGTNEVFRELTRKVPLFVVSNCQAGYIDECLSLTGLSSYVKEGLCPADTDLLKADNIRLLVEKYHLSFPVYVGDTAADHEACKKAGVPFIFASYGYGKTEDPDMVIDSIQELPDVILIK